MTPFAAHCTCGHGKILTVARSFTRGVGSPTQTVRDVDDLSCGAYTVVVSGCTILVCLFTEVLRQAHALTHTSTSASTSPADKTYNRPYDSSSPFVPFRVFARFSNREITFAPRICHAHSIATSHDYFKQRRWQCIHAWIYRSAAGVSCRH